MDRPHKNFQVAITNSFTHDLENVLAAAPWVPTSRSAVLVICKSFALISTW